LQENAGSFQESTQNENINLMSPSGLVQLIRPVCVLSLAVAHSTTRLKRQPKYGPNEVDVQSCLRKETVG